MKILKIGGLVILVLIIAALSLRFLSGPEDAWLCQNGRWVKHGQPSAPKPTAACGLPVGFSISITMTQSEQSEIEVFSPKANELVSSPLVVNGRVRGNWFFEASFPVILQDMQGKVLAQTPAQAQGDWMTTEFVPFEATLVFSPEVIPRIQCIKAPCINASLVLKKDNPSGLPQYDKEIRIPIVMSPEPTLAVKAFFSNNSLDPEISCVKVFPVERQITKTAAVARAALEELLKGPSELDKSLGFTTSINSGAKIQKLTIADGTAKVDFDETMEQGMGGSCRVSAIRAQITETLKQFSTVKDVIISVNGRTGDILQP